MEIRKTKMEDLDKLLAIYAHARAFMASHGNPTQWGNTTPPKERVIKDIEEGISYACVNNGEIVGVFVFIVGVDPTYLKIYDGNWQNDLPYGVVHRIASSGTMKGVGSFCIQWALEQCGNLRIDTHKDNSVMLSLLKKMGFIQCGTIIIADGTSRVAFQKTLETKNA